MTVKWLDWLLERCQWYYFCSSIIFYVFSTHPNCPGVRGQVTGINDWSPLAQESLQTCLEATGLHLARQQRFYFMMLSLCTNRAVKDGQTTRLTQTLMKRCHFIPKNQDEKKSYQTLSLLSYFIIFFSSSKQCTCTTIQTDFRTQFEALQTN